MERKSFIKSLFWKINADYKKLPPYFNNRLKMIDNTNCVFDVSKIEDRLKQLGALEDIDCEIINTK